ncbi:MAG: hypothetical protein JRF32_03200 [Deltaproteobacteria bacterium]|nr:hypothetical protein [Deltaproteobacteria bacterium]MBW2176908.1 hypothetical protein [Deltaproteobacteria bacterium]MBW2296601.1 hypothetical protein [Deltaproteobacteria bacterium]MBW2612941.1 hypothetical protein [Deltaproteobacteria bacterium]MBW2634849.1 hypothetical protein [Deltaproteobacteria bacterium]
MGEKQLKFLEFVPLILYITFARAVGTDIAGPQWKVSFVIGGAVSTFALIVLLRNKNFILNRITLGVNLFFISGTLAVVLRLDSVLDLYWRFNPAPMFAWVITVGFAATLFSPHGFTGTRNMDRNRMYLHSALLLTAAIIAMGISLFFQGKIVYADILPFIGLFIVNDRLQSRSKNESSSTASHGGCHANRK